MEKISGVTFHEAQIALARQWLGRNFLTQDVPREVYIKIPQETTEGIVVSNQTPVKTEKVPLPQTYETAVDIIRQFESGALNMRRNVADSVSQHALQDSTSLLQESWLGTSEEELNSQVKLCLWDHRADRCVVMSPSCSTFTPRS